MMNLIPGWPGIVTLHIASENGIQNRNRKGSSPPNPSPRGRADKTQIGCNPPPTKPSCSAKQGFMNRAYTNLPPLPADPPPHSVRPYSTQTPIPPSGVPNAKQPNLLNYPSLLYSTYTITDHYNNHIFNQYK